MTRLARIRKVVGTVVLLACLSIGAQVAAGARADRRTYVAERPGVLVKVTATPSRVVGMTLRAPLRCSDGSHSHRSLRLKFEGVTGTPIHGGSFLFHHGHATSVTIVRGSLTGAKLKGRFRYTTRLLPGNVRCGTMALNGRYVRFVATAGR